MKDTTLEDIRHLGEPVDDALRTFVEQVMPKHLWRLPKGRACGAKSALRCDACGAIVEIDNLLTMYGHGKRLECPNCRADAIGVDSWRGRAWLMSRMYTEWWRKSAVDPNVLVCIGFQVIRKFDTDTPVTYYYPLGFVVYEYGRAGRRYQVDCVDINRSRRMKAVNDMYAMTHGGWIAACPNAQFRNACVGTPFERLDLDMLDGKYVRACNMNFLSGHPCCEYLMRFGFGQLVKEAWEPGHMNRADVNWRGKTAQRVLKIGKARIREIQKSKITLTPTILGTIQRFEAMGLNWPMERILPFKYHLLELSSRAVDYKQELPEVIKYLDRQMRKNSGIQASDLNDYWRQCFALKMNLKELETLFPRDLGKMHRELTDRIRVIEEERRAVEKAKQKEHMEKVTEPKVAKVARKLASEYTFAACGLLLRPAASAAEVIDEGTALHHCVGGYVYSYAEGQTVLCVLRRAETPGIPYHTVEFSAKDGSLVQCRGDHNKTNSEDEPMIDAFWKAFEIHRTEKARRSA